LVIGFWGVALLKQQPIWILGLNGKKLNFRRGRKESGEKIVLKFAWFFEFEIVDTKDKSVTAIEIW
jgi:hypothetical protein